MGQVTGASIPPSLIFVFPKQIVSPSTTRTGPVTSARAGDAKKQTVVTAILPRLLPITLVAVPLTQ